MVLICSCRLKFLTRILFGKKVKPYKKDSPEPFQLKIEDKQDDLYVERIRIEKLKLRFYVGT